MQLTEENKEAQNLLGYGGVVAGKVLFSQKNSLMFSVNADVDAGTSSTARASLLVCDDFEPTSPNPPLLHLKRLSRSGPIWPDFASRNP